MNTKRKDHNSFGSCINYYIYIFCILRACRYDFAAPLISCWNSLNSGGNPIIHQAASLMKIPKALPADAGGSAGSRKRSRPKNKVQPREFMGVVTKRVYAGKKGFI